MRYAIFIALSLMLTACSGPDTKLQKQIIGTWDWPDDGMDNRAKHFATTALASDGSFHSLWTRVLPDLTEERRYEGTWNIKDGVLILTTTNTTAKNCNVLPVPKAAKFPLVRISSTNFVTAVSGMTNCFIRDRAAF